MFYYDSLQLIGLTFLNTQYMIYLFFFFFSLSKYWGNEGKSWASASTVVVFCNFFSLEYT